eukprot:12423493-Karenia_brevis.AAC.1
MHIHHHHHRHPHHHDAHPHHDNLFMGVGRSAVGGGVAARCEQDVRKRIRGPISNVAGGRRQGWIAWTDLMGGCQS